MENKHPLIERFGMFTNKNVECFDDNNLFIKSGTTVIGALAGDGKTTHIIEQSIKWRGDGYKVFHFNFDNAPTYNADMLEPPINEQDFKDFNTLLRDSTDSQSIVVIDSLKAMASYLGKDIENNTDMYPIMMNFREISKITGCSFILIHHVYKAKNVKTMPTSFYGSRAIEEQCDSGFIFEGNKIRIVKNRAGHQRDIEIQLDEQTVMNQIRNQ